ncbi:MAG: hypothetical protein ACOX6T_27555 [Myxococcales bacterium]|jgi:hypothetical protein
MSGALRTVIERLRREVLAAPRRSFDVGRARHPALAPHEGVASVLAALADDREHTYPERDALTRTLLAEHRESGDALWASMLLVAYYPMLSRLRHRLVCDTVPRDELDQVVVTAFLGAISVLSLLDHADRIALRLRQRTERQVFAFLRKEREQQRPSADPEELAMFGTETIEVRRLPTTDEELFDLALLLERAAELGIPRASIEVVAATVLRRELLRSYVDRVAPDDDLERERMYQRLKRQRTRVLRRLRALLRESPVRLASGF